MRNALRCSWPERVRVMARSRWHGPVRISRFGARTTLEPRVLHAAGALTPRLGFTAARQRAVEPRQAWMAVRSQSAGVVVRLWRCLRGLRLLGRFAVCTAWQPIADEAELLDRAIQKARLDPALE